MFPQGAPPPDYSHVIQVPNPFPTPDQQAEYAMQRTQEQRAELERHLGALAHSARFAQNYGYPRPQ
jgi:hypothetical protein